jgi:hypothetical protein
VEGQRTYEKVQLVKNLVECTTAPQQREGEAKCVGEIVDIEQCIVHSGTH